MASQSSLISARPFRRRPRSGILTRRASGWENCPSAWIMSREAQASLATTLLGLVERGFGISVLPKLPAPLGDHPISVTNQLATQRSSVPMEQSSAAPVLSRHPLSAFGTCWRSWRSRTRGLRRLPRRRWRRSNTVVIRSQQSGEVRVGSRPVLEQTFDATCIHRTADMPVPARSWICSRPL